MNTDERELEEVIDVAAAQTRPPTINAGETVTGCPPAVRHFSQTVAYFNLLIVHGFIAEGVEVLRDSASTASEVRNSRPGMRSRAARDGQASLF